MKLKDALNLESGAVISIVGAGGKTTLMFNLAEELRAENKILVTTTTKIYYPEKHQFDFITVDKKDYDHYNNKKQKGIYVYGSGINNEDKVIGLRSEVLEDQIPHFDYVLIEADGSKGKILKGWRNKEPIIVSKTNKTIGVLNIKSIGKKINEENIHRVNKFINITDSKEEELINIEHIISLIFHKSGLFKDAVGERILFINMVEKEDYNLAKKLVQRILENNNGYIDSIIIGEKFNKYEKSTKYKNLQEYCQKTI